MSLKEPSKIIVEECLNLNPDEELLIIVDNKTKKIGESILEAAKNLDADSILVEMIERDSHGEEPPKSIGSAMKDTDVFIAPTTKSLSHTEARKQANENGARGATMPGITEDIVERTMNAEYKKIRQRSEELAKILTDGKEAIVKSSTGTDIVMGLGDREAHPDTGIIHESGSFSNLPAGEGYIAPIEGTAEGKIVVDGSMAGIGVLDGEIEMEITNGKVKKITGEKSEDLKAILATHDEEKARNVAELGIGTNEKATLIGNMLEDEKVLGTAHLAIGDNSTFGGEVEVPVHLDGIIKNAEVKIDDETILKDGDLQI